MSTRPYKYFKNKGEEILIDYLSIDNTCGRFIKKKNSNFKKIIPILNVITIIVPN